MRIGNLAGRVALLSSTKALDIERASQAKFGHECVDIWQRWEDFKIWSSTIDVDQNPLSVSFDAKDLISPSPCPRQIFAIGLNYADHAAEANLPIPKNLLVFTKFASSLTGASQSIHLSSENVDWEAELVIVVGIGGRNIRAENALSHVAGFSVGQDISDRAVQLWGAPSAQFSLGKSFENYSPVGPWVVTLDEISARANLNELSISCVINHADGTSSKVQDGNTRDMIFSVQDIIVKLSEIVMLLPGDLIFTGTPAGVGIGRTPKMYIQPGDRMITKIEAVGEIVQDFYK